MASIRAVARFRNEILDTREGFNTNYLNDINYAQRVFSILYPNAKQTVEKKFSNPNQRFVALSRMGSKYAQLCDFLDKHLLIRKLKLSSEPIFTYPLDIFLQNLESGNSFDSSKKIALEESMYQVRKQMSDIWTEQDFNQYQTIINKKLDEAINYLQKKGFNN